MATTTQMLWERAAAGDRQAYDELFALHADRARLYIRMRLGKELRARIDVEDVLQEAYLCAHRDFASFFYSDEGAFYRWLCRIIANRIRDFDDYFDARKRTAVPIPKSNPTGPMTAFDRAEHRERVAAALEELSPEHRDVLLHRFFEGLSADETGALMGRSPGAVRKLAARALVELGKLLT